ncbi:DUF4760 domain-containing protein [Aeromicrobium sp.]|jgi:hypothetical protein|uniref:DUF4760 domain-containing protein n=1 Tax=Aeromicrobium sp. TaxID=1871063 RepID=UPI003C49CEC2
MNWSVVADVVNAGAVTIGVVFAASQLFDIRKQRKRDAMLGLVRSFQSGDFTTALRHINSLPDGADRAAIRATLGPDGEDQVFMIGLTFESLGVLVFRHEVTMDLIDDFFSGAIVISWRKLHVYVEEDRRDLGRETVWEWFQWLSERVAEREREINPVPAHVAHRDWT